ncbi:MAG: carboxypeptidase-like regulatory domain-containing protein [Cyclobacteriaceae bacterium]
MTSHKLIALWAVLMLSILEVSAQIIKGSIRDESNQEILPFATINFVGTSIGTISNENGDFELQVPEGFEDKQIEVSYMGYYSKKLAVDQIQGIIIIELKPSTLTLAELVIRPLSPQDYIKRVVKNMDKVLSQKAVQSQSYYREKFMENGQYLAFSEGIWKAFHQSYNDTTKNQYQLMLYETAENPAELQFMKTRRDKKNEKKRAKAEKKGEDFEPSEGLINATFGGPDEILEMDMNNELDEFLDSTYFKKFRYEFGTPMAFRDRELLVINFESKGKVDHIRSKGKIYIDTRTDAIASLDFDAEAVIPIAIEPILFAFGISLDNPIVKKQMRYQLIDGSWYPEYFYINVNMKIKKRNLFSANETSNFFIEQLFKINSLNAEDPVEINSEYRYNKDKDPSEQVFNTENLKWEDFSRLTDANQ